MAFLIGWFVLCSVGSYMERLEYLEILRIAINLDIRPLPRRAPLWQKVVRFPFEGFRTISVGIDYVVRALG